MKIKNLILLVALATLWGPSFLFIKVAVAEIPPISLAAMRIGLAALLLCSYLLIRGEKPIKSLKFWRQVTIAGFFAHAVPFVLINWGEVYIDSALASILNALTPLSTIIIANFMVSDDKMSLEKGIGTVLGLVGLLVLISPSLGIDMSVSLAGIVAVSLGAVSYGIAIVYSRLNLKGTKPLHAPASQLFVTSLYLVPFSIFIEGPYHLADVSYEALGSVLVLGSFGTALAFVIYYNILEGAGASYLSLVTYLMPIYGVALGVLFLGETVYIEALIGALLIVIGIMIVNNNIKIDGLKKLFTNKKLQPNRHK